MARYHINKNGVPAVCHAEKGKCPLGGVTGSENHYNSLEEAQTAVDNMHANDFINSSGDSPQQLSDGNVKTGMADPNSGFSLSAKKMPGADAASPAITFTKGGKYYDNFSDFTDEDKFNEKFEEVERVTGPNNLSLVRYQSKDDPSKQVIYQPDDQHPEVGTYYANEAAQKDMDEINDKDTPGIPVKVAPGTTIHSLPNGYESPMDRQINNNYDEETEQAHEVTNGRIVPMDVDRNQVRQLSDGITKTGISESGAMGRLNASKIEGASIATPSVTFDKGGTYHENFSDDLDEEKLKDKYMVAEHVEQDSGQYITRYQDKDDPSKEIIEIRDSASDPTGMGSYYANDKAQEDMAKSGITLAYHEGIPRQIEPGTRINLRPSENDKSYWAGKNDDGIIKSAENGSPILKVTNGSIK